MLHFFPTPYPDEIFYSVLCRYHMRSGSPSGMQTNLSLWGKANGKRLFLPDGIENIASQIPHDVGLTAARFIADNTIFPLLKPFLNRERGNSLHKAMVFGNSLIYNSIGFNHIFTLQHRYLRYCKHCIESDTKTYGEPYWHRIHQMPGVYICPTHNKATTESDYGLADLRREFHPLAPTVLKTAQPFKPGIVAKLLAVAIETAWMLQHGRSLGHSGHTAELYDKWLSIRGYRSYAGKTSYKRLAKDIVDFYGQEFLELFAAYNSGVCMDKQHTQK